MAIDVKMISVVFHGSSFYILFSLSEMGQHRDHSGIQWNEQCFYIDGLKHSEMGVEGGRFTFIASRLV